MRCVVLAASVAIAVFFIGSRASAVPVAPRIATLTQPDGSTFHARPWGDEHLTGFETISGYTVVRATDGSWRYATGPDVMGNLLASRAHVGDGAPPARKHLRPNDGPQTVAGSEAALHAPPGGVHAGTEQLLVILGEYADQPHQTLPADWQLNFFGTTGRTLRTFYQQSSYGTFDVLPATEACGTANDGIAGWFTLGPNHPDPELDDTTSIADAAAAAASSCVNFDAFDADHDGTITSRELHVIIILGGYETSYTGTSADNPSAQCGPSVWGHNAGYFGQVTVTPTFLSSYSMFGEMHCDATATDDHQATLGIMVHEFGHDIGWPDLYDIDYSSNGVGDWSIMSFGSWSKNATDAYIGESPALPDPFDRSYQGWMSPVGVVGTLANHAIAESETTPTVFRLRPNPHGVDWTFFSLHGKGEYFLVENRNTPTSGFDSGLPGCGILIWHIDESVSTFSPNANERHPLVRIMQADGVGSGSDGGDPFPGVTGKVKFNWRTHPSSRLYSGERSGASVRVRSPACASTMNADLHFKRPRY